MESTRQALIQETRVHVLARVAWWMDKDGFPGPALVAWQQWLWVLEFIKLWHENRITKEVG